MKREVGHVEAARMLGVSSGTLNNWRHWGIGPKWKKRRAPGPRGPARVVYLVADIERWLADDRCPACGRPKTHATRSQS